MDPARAHEFDPAAVPSVGQLLRELDEAAEAKAEAKADDESAAQGAAGAAGDDTPVAKPAPKLASEWEKTSLRPYVAALEAHARAIADDAAAKRRGGDDARDAKRVKSEGIEF